MYLQHIWQCLESTPLRESLTLEQLSMFIILCQRLLPAIKSNSPRQLLAVTLPTSILAMLSFQLKLDSALVQTLWRSLREDILSPTTPTLKIDADPVLASIGPLYGLGEISDLYSMKHSDRTIF